jgi:signal transduction histidine kinase
MLQVSRASGAAGGPLGRRGTGAIVVGIVLLLLIAAASVWTAENNASALTEAQRTRALRSALTSIMLSVVDAETGQRGYLLTTDQAYLAPLTASSGLLPGLMALVSAGFPGDPRAAQLDGLLASKLAELNQTVTLAKSGHLAEAMAIVRTNAGRQDMQAIRSTIIALEDDLDASLGRQVGRVTAGGRRLILIDIAGLLMVAATGGLIGLTMRAYLRTLAQAQAVAARALDEMERHNERLDEMVRSRTADLIAANEEVQRFAYIVSHDLRAPLVNIMGFTSELEQAAGSLERYIEHADAPAELREAVVEEIPEALRYIKSSTSKMDRLINAILKLSREGRRVLVAEPLDMPALFATMADTMQHQASIKAAEITIGSVPNLVADRLAVEQVFGNIIDNALKYLKPGRPGQLRIAGHLEGEMACYDITDNGRGIAERDYERVFELFRRAGDQRVPGEGIGLAHVRALVRRLGGMVDCKSTVDVGTTFTIRLPAVARYNKETEA